MIFVRAKIILKIHESDEKILCYLAFIIIFLYLPCMTKNKEKSIDIFLIFNDETNEREKTRME